MYSVHGLCIGPGSEFLHRVLRLEPRIYQVALPWTMRRGTKSNSEVSRNSDHSIAPQLLHSAIDLQLPMFMSSLKPANNLLHWFWFYPARLVWLLSSRSGASRLSVTVDLVPPSCVSQSGAARIYFLHVLS